MTVTAALVAAVIAVAYLFGLETRLRDAESRMDAIEAQQFDDAMRRRKVRAVR